MKQLSKKVIYYALCSILVTGLLGGIATCEATPLQLDNGIYQTKSIQAYDRDDRHRHHRDHHDDNDNNGGGDNGLIDGLVIGAVLGTIIANN
jgi:hypothetical protein